MTKALFSSILLSPLLWFGCQSPDGPEAGHDLVDFSTLARGSHIVQDHYGTPGFGRTVPELRILNSADEARRFLSAKVVGSILTDQITTVDFERHSVILLQLEMQTTGMIGVKIDAVQHASSLTRVYATELLPGAGPVTDDIGFPCHIVVTPKLSGSVELAALRNRIGG